MLIPDEYVQFFVEDASAVDEAYTLGTDAVIPVGVASIAADLFEGTPSRGWHVTSVLMISFHCSKT